jgi:hypothetical protein
MTTMGKSYRKMLAATLFALTCAGFAWSMAQSGDKFKTRLAPAPPLAPLARTAVAGVGAATATLSGQKLTVNGTFEKLASAATAANLCLGIASGARGECGTTPAAPSSFALMISPGTTGTLTGTVELNNEQVEALKKGRYYISIHSQGAPTGHLLGWLLAEKGK